jgi:aerobic-type carbon monoxide dehydrogenase small subunit (CoxS/CutS family)
VCVRLAGYRAEATKTGPDSGRLLPVFAHLRYPDPYSLAGPHPAWSLPMGEFVLHINGSHLSVTAAPEESLLSVLRDHLKLTGTHYGCGEGQCGACTVLLDGVAARSCLMPVGGVGGAHIVTIEGLEQNGRLTPVQQAFLDEGALQCGYCTSGMILSAVSLLRQTPHPTDQQIVASMNGNVCRCGTYPRILAAIRRAAHGVSQ